MRRSAEIVRRSYGDHGRLADLVHAAHAAHRLALLACNRSSLACNHLVHAAHAAHRLALGGTGEIHRE